MGGRRTSSGSCIHRHVVKLVARPLKWLRKLCADIDWMAKAAEPTSDRWWHEGMDASVLTNKLKRELDNTQAIGGLRSPHMSIAKLKAAPQFGTWILDF